MSASGRRVRQLRSQSQAIRILVRMSLPYRHQRRQILRFPSKDRQPQLLPTTFKMPSPLPPPPTPQAPSLFSRSQPRQPRLPDKVPWASRRPRLRALQNSRWEEMSILSEESESGLRLPRTALLKPPTSLWSAVRELRRSRMGLISPMVVSVCPMALAPYQTPEDSQQPVGWMTALLSA